MIFVHVRSKLHGSECFLATGQNNINAPEHMLHLCFAQATMGKKSRLVGRMANWTWSDGWANGNHIASRFDFHTRKKKKKLQWSLSHWKQNIASYTGSNRQWTTDRYDIHTKKEKKTKEEEETLVVAEPLEKKWPVILEATDNGLRTDMTFTQRRRRRWRKKKKLQWSLSHWKQHCQLYWKQQTMDYGQIWHSHKEGEEDEGRRRNSSGRWATGNNIASYTGSNKQWTTNRYDIHTKKEKKMKEEEETPVVTEPLETTLPVILEATNNGLRTDMTFTQRRRRRWRKKKKLQWSLSHWKQHCQLYWKQQTMDYGQIWHSHKEGEEDEGRRRNSSGHWATGNNIASYTGSNTQWTTDRYDIHTKKEKKMKEEEETPVVAEPLETTFPVILEATNNGLWTDMTFTQRRRRRWRKKKKLQWSLSHWKQHFQLYWKQQTMDHGQIWHSHNGEEEDGGRRHFSGGWPTNIASYTGSNRQWTTDRYDPVATMTRANTVPWSSSGTKKATAASTMTTTIVAAATTATEKQQCQRWQEQIPSSSVTKKVTAVAAATTTKGNSIASNNKNRYHHHQWQRKWQQQQQQQKEKALPAITRTDTIIISDKESDSSSNNSKRKKHCQQ